MLANFIIVNVMAERVGFESAAKRTFNTMQASG
jgi:hypothetical protein